MNYSFLVQNLRIFFFTKTLLLEKLEDTDFKYDNSIFKFQPKNTQIRHFWFQIHAFLFLDKILSLDKFEGADFKYENKF